MYLNRKIKQKTWTKRDQKDIRFYITMMKVAVNLMQEGSNKIQAFWYKLHKKKTFRYVCPTCDRSFKAVNQKKKDISCPYCD